MGILTWIVIGLAVGFLFSGFTNSRGGRRLTILIASLVGALIGWLNVAFLYQVPGAFFNLNWMVAVASLMGASLAVALFVLLRPQKVSVPKNVR